MALQEVQDPNAPLGRKTHCAAAFVSVLLSELASPYSLSISDQNRVRRWATNGALLTTVMKATDAELPEFVIDLTQDQALLPSNVCKTPRSKIRILDTSLLSSRLKDYRQQLKERKSPGAIGLGHDCDARQCSRLCSNLLRVPGRNCTFSANFLSTKCLRSRWVVHESGIHLLRNFRAYVRPTRQQTNPCT